LLKWGTLGSNRLKSAPGEQMGTQPAKVGRLGPRCRPGVLKCGAASTPRTDGRLRKKVFDIHAASKVAKVGAAGGPKLLKWGRLRARQGQIC
jgi:hypothetical protein